MSNMSTEDILHLLQTIEISRDYPTLKLIHDRAMKALDEVVKSLEEEAAKPAAKPAPAAKEKA